MPDLDLTQALADLRDAGEEFRPPPTAAALVRNLRERGLHVEPADAGVRIWPRRLLTAEDRAHLEARLDEVVALVHSRREPAVAPALRARMAGLLEQVRERLGDETSQRLLALFRVAPERAVAEAENALALAAAQGRVGDEVFRAYAWLLAQPGRSAGTVAAVNVFGDAHLLRYPDSREHATEVARIAELLGHLEDAGLAERAGSSVSARLPAGVTP